MRTPKLIVWILAILLALSIWPLFFGQGGYFRLQELREQYAQLKAENAKLLATNQQLAAEVESLKTGQEAIEEHARHDLNMVRPGEVLFRISRPQRVVPGSQISADIINDPMYRPDASVATPIAPVKPYTPNEKELGVELPPKQKK
ncbi:MAG: septum formation initiator family protein [Burkholderiaceae bacterium]|nr:septum formation initiator family protein [Burkholderiaceae bacterium]